MARRPTIDALLALAKAELKRPGGARELAQGVVDAFGEDQLCGMPEPEAYPRQVYVLRDMVGCWDPEQADSLALALLRAAEKAWEGI